MSDYKELAEMRAAERDAAIQRAEKAERDLESATAVTGALMRGDLVDAAVVKEARAERDDLRAHLARLAEDANRASSELVDVKAKLAACVAAKDGAYAERNKLVVLLAWMAIDRGWRAGVGVHRDEPGVEWEADWRTLVIIELPTGQAAWHFHDSERHLLDGLPSYDGEWDGHDTPEKYRRVLALAAKGGA